MTEVVWRHALNYLDTFRSGDHENDISALYHVDDSTGVLVKHKEKLMKSFLDQQVDMKIMYYELIKMLMEHDKDQQSEEEYNITKTVHKIEGYQELTNKLQRFMNQKFINDFADVNSKIDVLNSSIGNINIINKIETLEQNVTNLQNENKLLMERINVLDGNSSRFTEEFRLNIETKMDDFAGTKERLEKTIVMIGDNKTVLNKLIEKTDKHQDDLDYLLKTVDNREDSEKLRELSDDVKKVEEMVAGVETKLTSSMLDQKRENDECVAILYESVDKIKKGVDDNQTNLNNVQNTIDDVKEKHDILTEELDTSTKTMLKNKESIVKIEKTVEDLETRTTETVERMKEVIIISDKIDNNVKNINDQFEKHQKEAFGKIDDNIKELSNISKTIDALKDTADGKYSSIDASIKNLGEEAEKDRANFLESLVKHKDEFGTMLDTLDDESKSLREKVVLLEEGYSAQESRIQLMNTLGSRLTLVEERRQESDAADARMKSDLDQRLVKSQTDLESLQSELEQQIQSLQTSVDSIKTSVQDQRAEIDFSLVELRNTANENEVRLTQLVSTTNEMRSSVYQEIQTNIQEKISQVNVMVQELQTKSNDVGQVIKDEYKEDMKKIGEQLNTIYLDYEKIEKKIGDFRTKYDEDYEELVTADKNLGDSVKKTDDKMEAVIEKANILLVNDARQDESLVKLDDRVKNLETKHDSLEEADKFLQESQRQTTEKQESHEIFTKKSVEDLELKIVAISGLRGSIEQLEKKQEEDKNDLNSQIEVVEERLDQLNTAQKDMNQKLDSDLDVIRSKEEEASAMFQNFKQETEKEIENMKNKEDTLDSGFKSMLDTSNSVSSDIENVEDELKKLQESVIELQFKSESPKVVETLSAEIDKLNKEKKETDDKTLAEIEALIKRTQELEAENVRASERLQEVDTYAQGVNTKVEELENSLEEKVSEVSRSSTERYSNIEKTFVKEMSEKVAVIERETKALENNFDRVSTEESEKLRKEIEEKISALVIKDDEQSLLFDELKTTLEDVNKQMTAADEKVAAVSEEQHLVVERLGNQENSMEKMFSELERMSSSQETEMLQLRESSQSQMSLFESGLESRLGDLQTSIHEVDSRLTINLHDTKRQQASERQGLLTLTLEMYTAFNGFCILIKASKDSLLSQHQPQLLGVYRLVDSYNDRPVYKQDMGENYIYYSSAGSCWQVGCQVGHHYSWLRNKGDSASGARWPSLLTGGWEVRCREAGGEWRGEEGVSVETIRDIEKIKEIIRDMEITRNMD